MRFFYAIKNFCPFIVEQYVNICSLYIFCFTIDIGIVLNRTLCTPDNTEIAPN
jgi:hypothetical protein